MSTNCLKNTGHCTPKTSLYKEENEILKKRLGIAKTPPDPLQGTNRGELREEQIPAADEMLKSDNGVLSATTAFGKTVVAEKLIAERKVSTLVLTHRRQLLAQWTAKLTEFLDIDEALPLLEKKRGRKRKQNLIGQIGAGKSHPSVIIDVAPREDISARDLTNPAWIRFSWPCPSPGREPSNNTRAEFTGSMKANGKSASMTTLTSMSPCWRRCTANG